VSACKYDFTLIALFASFTIFVLARDLFKSFESVFDFYQFDLEPTPAGQSAISSRWLSACFLSIGQDNLLNGPITICIKSFINAFLARKQLIVEEEKKLILDEMSQVKGSDLDFQLDMQDPIKIDEFVSWLMRKLLWMPKVGEKYANLCKF
jgi:hypothetical protein